jgi:uncharacterized protein YkwD
MVSRATSVALFVAALFGCAQPVRVTAPAQPTTSVDDEVRTVVDLINQHRKRFGCRALQWDRVVADVAKAHSADMVRRNFVSHTNPDGVGPFQRLARAGIRYTRAAENIAAGQKTGAEVFQSWMQSPGHRRNIEDCALAVHGVGFTRGAASLPYGTITNAWTNVFVTPR